MKNKGKNILVCLLLLVAFTPVVLPLILVVEQAFVVHAMHEKLEKESLITIHVQRDEVVWIKKGKECLIKGKLFDIKYIVQNGTILVLTGLPDEEETRIRHQVETTSGNTGNNARQANIIFGYTQLIAVVHSVNTPQVLLIKDNIHLCSDGPTGLLPGHYNLFTPPPDNA